MGVKVSPYSSNNTLISNSPTTTHTSWIQSVSFPFRQNQWKTHVSWFFSRQRIFPITMLHSSSAEYRNNTHTSFNRALLRSSRQRLHTIAHASTAASASSISNPLISMHSRVRVTVKVSLTSPTARIQENFALQVSSVESWDAHPWSSPFAASAAAVMLGRAPKHPCLVFISRCRLVIDDWCFILAGNFSLIFGPVSLRVYAKSLQNGFLE